MVKPWGMHAIGARLTLDNSIADLLIESGRAKRVEKLPDEPAGKPKPKVKLQEWVKKPNAA